MGMVNLLSSKDLVDIAKQIELGEKKSSVPLSKLASAMKGL